MELVTAGWCTWKWLRLDHTIINLACGDVEISVVVIQLGVTGLKKTWFMYLVDLFGGRWEKEWCGLVCRGIFR